MEDLYYKDENKYVNAYENANDSYRFGANKELNWPKPDLIFQLNKCSSKDSQKEIARLLNEVFSPWPSKDGHWLYIAQTYTVRVIIWVLSATIKQYRRGGIRKTPAHYFTNEIKFRVKRRPNRQELTDTIGGCKQERGKQ